MDPREPLDPETREKLRKTTQGEHRLFKNAIRSELRVNSKKANIKPDEVAQKCPNLSREQVEVRAFNEVFSQTDKKYLKDQDSSLHLLAMTAKMMASDDYPEAAVDSNSVNNRPANPNWLSTSQVTTWKFEDFDSLSIEEQTRRLNAFKEAREKAGNRIIVPTKPQVQEGPRNGALPNLGTGANVTIKEEVVDHQYESASSSSEPPAKKPKIEL